MRREGRVFRVEGFVERGGAGGSEGGIGRFVDFIYDRHFII